jgi:hypothetical protein
LTESVGFGQRKAGWAPGARVDNEKPHNAAALRIRMDAMSPDVISRKSARAVGQTFYFTGKSCKHGHVAGRYSHNGACVVCNRLRAAQWKKTAKGRKYRNEWQNKRRAQQRAERAAKNSREC